MKIVGLSTDDYGNQGKQRIGVTVEYEDLSLHEAVSAILAMFNPPVVSDEERIMSQKMEAFVKAAGEAPSEILKDLVFSEPGKIETSAPAEPAKRTRKPRHAPVADATEALPTVDCTVPEDAKVHEAVSPQPAPPGARRPRTFTPSVVETPEPVTERTVTDADLSKACSHAASIVGREIVTSVLGFFDATTTAQIKPMARENFIATLGSANAAAQVIGKDLVKTVATEVEQARVTDNSIDAAAVFVEELRLELLRFETDKAKE